MRISKIRIYVTICLLIGSVRLANDSGDLYFFRRSNYVTRKLRIGERQLFAIYFIPTKHLNFRLRNFFSFRVKTLSYSFTGLLRMLIHYI